MDIRNSIVALPTSSPIIMSTVINIEEQVDPALVVERDADPIKDRKTIENISAWFLSQGKYRENLAFVCGCNLGMRVSDLIKLKLSHLLDTDLTLRTEFRMMEQKTAKTRKTAKNRVFYPNQAIKNALDLYLGNLQNNGETIDYNGYLFTSQSNHKGTKGHLNRSSIYRQLNEAKVALGLNMRLSTHSMRKTFGYQLMADNDFSMRALIILQKMFGHSSPTVTLDYVGITSDEIMEYTQNLNLGLNTEAQNNLRLLSNLTA